MLCPRFFVTDWLPLKGQVHHQHICAIGDIHGQSEALSHLLSWLEEAEDLGPRQLISLGNVIGHNPGGHDCLDMLKDTAFGPAHLLPGEQEINFARAMRAPQKNFHLWETKGGQAILSEHGLLNMPAEKAVLELFKIYTSSYPSSVLEQPGHIKIDDRLFVHAGLSPYIPQDVFLKQSADQNPLFDCHWAHITTPFLNWEGGWGDNLVVVHGHSIGHHKWFANWDHIGNIYKPALSRINLNINSQNRPQIAWAEFVDGYTRVGAVSMRQDDLI